MGWKRNTKWKLQRIDAVVSVSTAHGLIDSDVINLSINPSQSVGIGK